MNFEGLAPQQRRDAQRRLNIEKAERKRQLKAPCAMCMLEKPWRPRHLLPGQTCATHNHTDPRPFLRPDRTWLKEMRQQSNKSHPPGP